MTLRQLCDESQRRLAAHFPDGEARWMVRIIMEQLKGYTLADIAIKSQDEVSDYITGKVRAVVDRLLADEPIQYIFGEARFYGLKLKVTPDTLIPRPETEELVDMIVQGNADRTDLRVLDACTGSGCIALALSRNLPFSRVDAFDLSDKALAVARENAAALKAKVDFFKADAFNLPSEPSPVYDIIVSNPPYIAERERKDMEPNVLLYEPHSALFVPDAAPLEFYDALNAYALTALKPGGQIYYELNPLHADELALRMRSAGWTDVTVALDIERRKRFLTAKLPSR